MPPGLISSAAPGKKAAAPKAAPRRRAAAVVPAGPPPSAAVVAGPPTGVAPPTPDPTQNESQTPVGGGPVQQGKEARLRESEVKIIAKDAAVRPETVAEDVSYLPPIAVERACEAGPIDTALPTPEPTQTETAHQSGAEAERRDDDERQRAEEARLALESEESVRQTAQREATRQAARNEELAVTARQAAEQEDARRSEVNATQKKASSSKTTAYVPPSASSATPATVDPTTLPLPPRPDAAPKPNAKRPRAEKSSTIAQRPRKKAKSSSARSNAKVQDIVNSQGEADFEGGDVVMTTETDGAMSKPKQKRKPAAKRTVIAGRRKELSVSTIQNSDDETEGQEGQAEQEADAEGGQEEVAAKQPAAKKHRIPRTKRATKTRPANTTAQPAEGPAEGENGTRAVDAEGNEEDEADSSDPELHEIDPNAISMWELSRDEYHGKKSERGKKMAEIDWDKVAQDRRDAANALVASFRTDAHLLPDSTEDAVASLEGRSGTAELEGSQGRRSQSRAATTVAAPTPAPANDDLGLGFVLDADGNIVADENTMTFTRDAAAQAAANTDAPIEEFNDLTQTVNRFTHLNANRRDPADRLPPWKSKSDPWSEYETDKFYDALRMFGTDFFIISKMFAPKTRRMIKNKFNREEKLDPNRINRALTGIVETPMSLEHYSRETGFAMEKFTKYEGVEHAQNVIDCENAGKEVVDEKEVKRREKEAARVEKEKEKEREKEERKAKRKAKTKKGMAEAGGAGFGGGGPIEDVVGGAE